MPGKRHWIPCNPAQRDSRTFEGGDQQKLRDQLITDIPVRNNLEMIHFICLVTWLSQGKPNKQKQQTQPNHPCVHKSQVPKNRLTWVHILTVYIYYFNVDALLPSVFFWASHLLSIPLSCLLIWLGMTFLLNTCVLTSHNTIDLWQLVWCSSNFAFLPLSLSVIYVTCFFHINAVGETSHGIPSSCSQFHVEPSFFCCDLCYLDSQDGFVFLLEEV